ncbi:rhodanese-like domain-containing protein [Moraxella sp. ZY210820]|uniref:rhodanese-like domain-containing protein n=1 Tax=unclassified Moraxella TaxID=2685852 RepID=UPI00272FFA6B|nr:rhodanese-like domain-containing protein [Moraxella sp. ZY210820]WLF83744.1 rhodanese-like domain-containing protein [Moraxella sp. ZY210820]
MERWFQFMGNHPILFGVFFALITAYWFMEMQRSGRKISSHSLGVLMKSKNAMVIDLRDNKDFRDGHISGSRNIPYSQLSKHIDELKTAERPLVFVCNLGHVAGSALAQVGYADSYRLDGGITQWKADGLPLVKAKK